MNPHPTDAAPHPFDALTPDLVLDALAGVADEAGLRDWAGGGARRHGDA